LEDAKAAEVDQMKFMCGQKHKYNENGSVLLIHDNQIAEVINVNTTTPQDLTGGRDHFDDAPRYYRRPL
jgi:hypothetical protein